MTLHDAAILALQSEIKNCEDIAMRALHRRDQLVAQLGQLTAERDVRAENHRASKTPVDFAYPRMRGAQ